MVRETTCAELREKRPSVAVIDIRDPQSFAQGHIPGSENIPAQALDHSIFDRDWPDEIVVSCYIGKSSKRVASILDARLDATVTSLEGGFDAWSGDVESGQ